MRVRACAVGQASAAIFARRARGLGEREIALALAKLEAWLDDQGPAPQWPGLNLIAAARDYPARHGAMLLPWKAALAALSSARPTG
jgi:NifU-like protein involved in Fe-S cluster formation